MVRTCCVEGCSASKEDISFYKFPKSRILKRKWLEAVNLKKVTINSLICSEHFTDGDHEVVRGKRKLRSQVVPSVFSDRTKSPEPTKEAWDGDSITNNIVNNGGIKDVGGKDEVETGGELQENGERTEENEVLDLSNKEPGRNVSPSPKHKWDEDTISNSPDITKDDIEDILTNYHIKQNKRLPSESGTEIQPVDQVKVAKAEENRVDQVEREELPPDKDPGDDECIDVDKIQDKSQPVFIEVSVDQDPNGPDAGTGSPRDCLMLLESVQVDVDPATLMLPDRESDVEVLEKKDEPISLLTSSDEDDVIIQEPHIDTVEVSDETDEDDMPLVKLVKTKKTKKPKNDALSKIMWGVYEYYCVKCNYTTTSRAEHRVHVAGHSTAVHICPLCSYTTASKAQFARHKRKHMEERKHKCHLCDYKARHSMSLIYHLKSHDRPKLGKLCSGKVKKFSCDKCCYETKRQSDLKRHQLRRHKDFVEEDDEYVPPAWV